MSRLLPLPSFRDLNKVALGLVTMLAIGGMVGGAFAVGTLGLLQDRYEMTGVFVDSGGLKPGAVVRVAGIDVGQVKGVAADYSTGQVIITWEVDSGVELGPNTRAEIGTATLLGGDFLKLTDTEGTPRMRDLSREERRIPLERTNTPYTVIEALSDVTERARDLDVGAINDVILQVAGSLSNNSATISGLVANLGTIGTAVNQRQEQLDQLIANGQQVTATLASRDQELAQLIDQADGLLDALNSRREQLSSLLGSSSDVVNQLAALIEDKRSQIDSILSDVHSTLAGVERQLPSINTGLAYAGPTLVGLGAVATGQYFSVEITGVSAASLNELNRFLDSLLGPD